MPRKTIALAVASLLAVSLPARALPDGADVVSGSAELASSGSTLTVTNSSGAIINWQDFNIASGETTNFVQPSASSTVLNRVTGSSEASSIFGSLTSNGQVFLINPNGILFGPDAQVDVGGLVASTLDIGDADFLAGNFQFDNGGSSGALVNQGSIQADGYIALFAPDIDSSGSVSTPGNVLVAAGNGVSADFSGGSATDVTVTNGSAEARAELGPITAGGAVVLVGGSIVLNAQVSGGTVDVTAWPLAVGTGPSLTSYGGGSLTYGAGATLSVIGFGNDTLTSGSSAPAAYGGTLSIGSGSVELATVACGGTNAACDSVSVSQYVWNTATFFPLQPGSISIQLASLPTIRPVKTIASLVLPAGAPVVAAAPTASFAPQPSPAASGLLTLNLEKRDLSF